MQTSLPSKNSVRVLGRSAAAWASVAAMASLQLYPATANDNFLIIVADDLGVDAVGIYSRDDLYRHPGEGASPGPTPTIDSLALEGLLFRNAYANPTCSPTRAALLTGQYSFRLGVGTPQGVDLGVEHSTLPELLDDTHRNGASGKWHLGPVTDLDHPIETGFDHFSGTLSGAISSYFSWPKLTNSTSTDPLLEPGFSTYATTDNVDEAIDLIAGFDQEPWFVWLAFSAPHDPFHVPPEHLVSLDVNSDSSDSLKYRAAVEALDTEIARLLGTLSASVLADTTIFFVGDNGTPRQAVEPPFLPHRAKGSVYEGGINIPLIVKSPLIDPEDRGSESRAVVNALDILATIADIVGLPAKASPIDSVSLLPYFVDPSLATQSIRPFAYSEIFSPNGPGPYDDVQRAIRNDDYKLIWRNGEYQELFRLQGDRFEQDNLFDLPLDEPAETAFLELATALEHLHSSIFSDGFESGDLDRWSTQ